MYTTLCSPITCQVELTTACNHNCSHCYNFWRKEQKGKGMSLTRATVEVVVKKIATAGVFDIVVTGGEPLMAYGTLVACIKSAKESGLGVSMNSNLVPLNRSRVRELYSLGVKHILTSLMGPTSEIHDTLAQSKGSFEKVVKNIRMAQEEGVRVVVNMVVSKFNLAYVKDTARLVSTIGVKKFSATKAGCPGNCSDFSAFSLTLDEFRQYLRDLREVGEELGLEIDALEGYPLCGIGDLDYHHSFIGRKCYAGVTTATIASDGSVRPCSHLDISCGNIFEEDLKEIWNRMDDWRSSTYLPHDCKMCDLLPICGGGCRMEAKMRFGDISAPDPYCAPENIKPALESLANYRARTARESLLSENFAVMSYRSRAESFGATILVGGKSRSFLSKNGFEILKQFITGTTYSVGDERITWGEIDPRKFVTGLIQRGIAISK